MNILSFKNYSFSYSDDTHAALHNIALNVEEGESIVVSGLSGSGKSTLCMAASDLTGNFPASISEGEIRHGRRSESTRSSVSVVLQNFYAQITYLRSTVFEEIAFPCKNIGLERNEIIKRVEDTISKMKIENLAYRNPLELSGGEKQKVVIAAAIAVKPYLLVLDEPMSQLDSESTRYLGDLLLDLKREVTLFVAENDPYLSLKIADRLVLLYEGQIIADGPPAQVLGPLSEPHVDLPAWTKCVSEATRRKLFSDRSDVNPFELNYRLALSALMSLK